MKRAIWNEIIIQNMDLHTLRPFVLFFVLHAVLLLFPFTRLSCLYFSFVFNAVFTIWHHLCFMICENYFNMSYYFEDIVNGSVKFILNHPVLVHRMTFRGSFQSVRHLPQPNVKATLRKRIGHDSDTGIQKTSFY